MKVGFFGDGPWSHQAFNLIHQSPDYEISFVCTRNDPGDIFLIDLAKKNKIDFLQNKNVNSSEFLSLLGNYGCDIFVSLAFNQIFKESILELPKHGIINCHAGKLPLYRGRNILNWALINDEREFGITVHFVDKGVDTGDIILQNTYPITDLDTYKTLLDVAYSECGNLVVKALEGIRSNKVNRIKQDKIGQGFYCVGRKDGDEIINWNQNSREIFNFIRAITDPGPNARSFINGKEMKIVSSLPPKGQISFKGIAGSILEKKGNSITIKTKDSQIIIDEYIFDGKFKVGDRFE